MKSLLVNTTGLSGKTKAYQTSRLPGIESRKAWVCPDGVDPEKLSDTDRKDQCRMITLAGLPRLHRNRRKSRKRSTRAVKK